MSRAAPAAMITAATSCADRPTTPAISSSVRPVSSSARVRRITVKIAINPIMVAASTPIRHAVIPPTEVDPIGPSIARNAGFAVIDAASAARSAWSGYSEAIAENVDAATALTPMIQISNGDPLPPQVQPDQHPQPDQLTRLPREHRHRWRPATVRSSWSFRTPRKPWPHHDDRQRWMRLGHRHRPGFREPGRRSAAGTTPPGSAGSRSATAPRSRSRPPAPRPADRYPRRNEP